MFSPSAVIVLCWTMRRLLLRARIRQRPYPLCTLYQAKVLDLLPVLRRPPLRNKGSTKVATPNLLASQVMERTTTTGSASIGPGSIPMPPFFIRIMAFMSQFEGSVTRMNQGNAPGKVVGSRLVPKWPGRVFGTMLQLLRIPKVSCTRVKSNSLLTEMYSHSS